MDEQGYKFGVGVLVVASLVIAIILILFFGAAPNFFAQQYVVTIRFESAPGVATDTPVRKNGVQIGRVKDIELKDDEGVDLTLELDSKYRLKTGELPRIGSSSIITGDAVVEFISPAPPESLLARFDGTGGSPANGMLDENELALANSTIENGDFLRGGVVKPDPLEALVDMQRSFDDTLGAIASASNEINLVAGDFRRLIGGGDGKMQQISEEISATIANFNQTLDSIESLFNDPNLRSSLATVSERLPQFVNETEAVIKQTKNTLQAFEKTGLAAESAIAATEGTINNITAFTEPLAENGDEIVAQAMRTLTNLDRLLADLRGVSARLNNADGTVAKLLEDDKLYYSILSTLENVERVTRSLQPIVNDARVFSDKIARDPSSILNLRTAIERRPPGIGFK